MAIYKITKESAPSLKSYCPKAILSNIGANGYTTLAYFDEDEFLSGVLQFFIDDSKATGDISAIITYLFVHETFRRCQIATLLLDQLVDVAKETGIRSIEVDLLSDEKPMEELRCFFSSYNFEFLDGGLLYSAYAKEFLDHPALNSLPRSDIHDLTDLTQEKFSDELKKVLPADSSVSLVLNDYDKRVSSYFSEGSTTGFFLLQKRASDVLEIVLFTASGNADNLKKLDLILSSAKKVRELYNSHTIIRVIATAKDSKDLVRYLCPDITPIGILHGHLKIS